MTRINQIAEIRECPPTPGLRDYEGRQVVPAYAKASAGKPTYGMTQPSAGKPTYMILLILRQVTIKRGAKD
jgi:hypothetical protein